MSDRTPHGLMWTPPSKEELERLRSAGKVREHRCKDDDPPAIEMAELSDRDIRDIENSTASLRALADLYGVSKGCIENIKAKAARRAR